jgi:hypothetical protein
VKGAAPHAEAPVSVHYSEAKPGTRYVHRRLVDWIWHIRGSLALAPGQSIEDAFARLGPLFRQTGTSHERTNGSLVFCKKDPAAQDKMSIFDGGILRIEEGVDGSVLHYHLTSRALLLCFLAPLLFLAFAQFTIAVAQLSSPSEAAGQSGKASDALKNHAKKDAVLTQNPIDKALGAPAPEKPKKDGPNGDEEDDKKPSPTPAYVFAAIFAALYVVGRILEGWLVKALFKKRLLGS